MDYLIIVGPKKLLVNFITLATSQGYQTYTRLNQPKPDEHFVIVINTITKEISKFSSGWYSYYHNKRTGILDKSEKFPAYHISANRMEAFMKCGLTFNYYIIKPEFREIGEPYALRYIGKTAEGNILHAFSKNSVNAELGTDFYSEGGIIEQLLPIKKTRYDWIINNGNIWK